MTEVDLSICIVTYEAQDYLRACLRSIDKHPPDGDFETIVADNHSTDNTLKMLKSEFPGVQIIESEEHQGYTAPMNQALERSRGAYLLQLNPDTLVQSQAIDQLRQFLENHPEVGICGPKVLNPDGTLQPPCRRGESRPWAVFSYFLRLHDLFPRSKLFGGYLMNYMDEDETHAVAGVSGSCMMIRREVVEQIGYLDERFFAYQEDADYCLRAREAGWQVFYVPTAKIIHFGGQGGSAVHPYRSIFEWHRSYWLYYRKHFAKDYFFAFNWVYYGFMGLKLVSALLLNLIRRGRFQ